MKKIETASDAPADATKPGVGLLDFPLVDPATATAFFHAKLSFETDPADVWEALQAGEKEIVVIDTRSPELFEQGHVPGAVNLPWREMNESTTAAIPKNKLIEPLAIFLEQRGASR